MSTLLMDDISQHLSDMEGINHEDASDTEHMRRFKEWMMQKRSGKPSETRFPTDTFSLEAHGAEVSTEDQIISILDLCLQHGPNPAMTMRTNPRLTFSY
ncbi:hypothetical protein Tco_1562889 [Tanacetum coccineum]